MNYLFGYLFCSLKRKFIFLNLQAVKLQINEDFKDANLPSTCQFLKLMIRLDFYNRTSIIFQYKYYMIDQFLALWLTDIQQSMKLLSKSS